MHRMCLMISISVALLWTWSAWAAAQTRDYCRNKADEREMVICIEKGVYDPCDDSSGSGSGWWTAQCAWAHLTIAEKKIKATEEEIVTRLKKAGSKPEVIAELTLAQNNWRQSRDSYCKFANAVRDSEAFEGEVLGYCLRRLTEVRAKELQGLLRRDQ